MAGNYKTYQVGDFTVTRVFEKTSTVGTPQFLFPDWDPTIVQEHEHWLVPGSMDEAHEHLIRSIHTWVVRTKHHTILVDTATGNDKERPFIPSFHHLHLPYLDRLKAIGVAPEAVDYVLFTHLHADHVGWNTQLVDNRWIPTFPNAKYIFPKAEQQFFSSSESHNEHHKTNTGVYEDSVLPIIEAGQAEMIDISGGELLDGIAFHPTPGHTIGHMAISLTSLGQSALFGGDVMHHPLQVYHPKWNTVFCEFAEQARASRLWTLEYAAERRAIYFSGHFAESSAGFVTRKGDRFQWRFE